jgi:triphosphoribosyl-dephospho-CoA synthase
MIMQMQYLPNRVGALPFSAPSLFPADNQTVQLIARAAINALSQELCAYPKPGLVSLFDSGSHQDMDALTFMTSVSSLRTYFQEIALAGMRNACFDELRCFGLAAESRMLRATKNINTHRGAIFTLGLLAAAAGSLISRSQSLEGHILSHVVSERWGNDILLSTPCKPCSHGTFVASQYGVAGAREEAAAGFPHVFNLGLPVLQNSLLKGVDFHSAIIQSFFSIMTVMPDNNLLFRGGEKGLLYAQVAAQSFLDEGGVYRENWQECARHIHHEFIDRRLSPGGSADLLSATLFIHRLQVTLRNGGLTNRGRLDADHIEPFLFLQ